MSNETAMWNGYPVHGDVKELDRIIKSEELINLDKEALLSMLAEGGNNYLTSGVSTNFGEAFTEAVKKLPCDIAKANALAIDFCLGTKDPIISEFSSVTAQLATANPESRIKWGVSSDDTLGDTYKVTLLASVKA